MSCWLFLLILAIVVFAVIATARQNRRHAALTDMRLCKGCGMNHAPHAAFCRHCGRALDQG